MWGVSGFGCFVVTDRRVATRLYGHLRSVFVLVGVQWSSKMIDGFNLFADALS